MRNTRLIVFLCAYFALATVGAQNPSVRGRATPISPVKRPDRNGAKAFARSPAAETSGAPARVAVPPQPVAPKTELPAAPQPAAPTSTEDVEGAEFKNKLSVMYKKTESSIKLLREQIIQNQSAPFLADLFLQLADLLSEKSNILYYQQIEKEKTSNLKLDINQKLNPIVVALQDSIQIYEQILKEFPNFTKRDKVLYRLAVAQKSLDEAAAFVTTAEKLLAGYPKAKETMQVRLLLGQYYYDQQEYAQATSSLLPVAASSFAYERNAARYRLGLIAMNSEKFVEALKYFETIATDEELKEQENPLEVSVKTRSVNSNIKREALIDSIRAYTESHKKNGDPIAFYNRISPSEALFQEVIEKLAYRYILLKDEKQAMELLRVLSERVADPQKVINIYQDVLVMIPPAERIEIPYNEMAFVLHKYNDWLSYFEITQEIRLESYRFFETQIREMGTRSHDIAKSELSTTRKDTLYERARNFYHLYLGFFNKGTQAVKVATNLADVYYYQKNFLRSGDLYLRIYQGEFGPSGDKETLLQNAILCFQKPAPSDFYEIVRNRGLLVNAIQNYMKLDAKKKNDPKLNFILVKSAYEQGLYKKALAGFVDFIAKYPKAQVETEAAADIGLDYFNIRSDFKGLSEWAQKVIALKDISPELRRRMQAVRSKALIKKIDEEVKGKSNYDAFAQGKVYFEKALSMQDDSMKSVVLEQALARSKSEKDIATFLKVARTLASAEKSPEKKAAIILGMADQTLAIGRYQTTFGIWNELVNDGSVPEKLRAATREKSLRLALMMKDWSRIQGGLRQSASALKSESIALIGQFAESAAASNDEVFAQIRFEELSSEELTPFFRGQFKLNPSLQLRILKSAQTRCASQRTAVVCRWMTARWLPEKVTSFKNALQAAPSSLPGVETTAAQLGALLQQVQLTEETGDPGLDIFTSLYKAKIFQYFAEYLKKVGAANAQFAEVLNVKATESLQSAKQEYAKCGKIVTASSHVSPIVRYCVAGKAPTLKEALTWPKNVRVAAASKDPVAPEIEGFQKSIFADPAKVTVYMELAESFYLKKASHHAVALASYGTATFPQAKDEFEAILGCGLVELGHYAEAAFHLKNAGEFKNLKSQCLAQLKKRTE